jgi:hypothetical protein
MLLKTRESRTDCMGFGQLFRRKIGGFYGIPGESGGLLERRGTSRSLQNVETRVAARLEACFLDGVGWSPRDGGQQVLEIRDRTGNVYENKAT